MINGDPGISLEEPSVVVREYTACWKKQDIDIAELARLRWQEQWEIPKLVDHFGLCKTTIKKKLGELKGTPHESKKENSSEVKSEKSNPKIYK